jgi:hypothetical protein
MAMKPRATLRQNSYEDLTSAINKLLVGKSEFTHIYQNCLNCKFGITVKISATSLT